MSLLKRIGNLWHLSVLDPIVLREHLTADPREIIQKDSRADKNRLAVIIKRKKVDPIDWFIGENKDDKTSV